MFKCPCGHESKTAVIKNEVSERGTAEFEGPSITYDIVESDVHEQTYYCEECEKPLTDY